LSLKARIAALIEAQGPMSVAQFMTISLLDPQQGYYATRDPLGAGGDFTTAPEISQMFGEMVGLWLVQAWADQGCPKNPRLVELGPGRGTLMADILRTAKVAPEFLEDLEVVLIEASPALQQVQADKLRGLGADVSWAAQFDDSLADRPLFLVANEFFDALPVDQYQIVDGQWQRKAVVNHGDVFAFAAQSIEVDFVPASIQTLSPDAWAEYSEDSVRVMQQLAAHVAKHDGTLLIIDYGYQGPAVGDTVQALKHHQYHDVLEDVGNADITAHVDFGTLAAAAAPLRTAVVSQKEFLNNTGARERLLSLCKDKDEAAQNTLHEGYKRLTDDDQMGQLFKVLMAVP